MSTRAIDPYGNVVWINDLPGVSLTPPGVARVSQSFGVMSVTGIPHKGLDIVVNTGTPLWASDDGTVNSIYTNGYDAPGLGSDGSPGGYGNQVRVTHAWGESRYAHLTTVKVYVGQKVQRGDLVGYSGTTGISSGPHVHWEVRETRSWPFDPVPYLNLDDTDTTPPTPEEEGNEQLMARYTESELKILDRILKLDSGHTVAIGKGLIPLGIAARDASFTTANDPGTDDSPFAKCLRRLTRTIYRYSRPVRKATDPPSKNTLDELAYWAAQPEGDAEPTVAENPNPPLTASDV